MQFSAFVEWGFLGLLSFACIAMVTVMIKIYEQLAEMNTKLAVVIVEHKQTKAELEDHEYRIRKIELKRG